MHKVGLNNFDNFYGQSSAPNVCDSLYNKIQGQSTNTQITWSFKIEKKVWALIASILYKGMNNLKNWKYVAFVVCGSNEVEQVMSYSCG